MMSKYNKEIGCVTRTAWSDVLMGGRPQILESGAKNGELLKELNVSGNICGEKWAVVVGTSIGNGWKYFKTGAELLLMHKE